MAGAMAVVTVPVRLVWRLPGWRRRWRRRVLAEMTREARAWRTDVACLGLDAPALARFRRDAVRIAVTRHRAVKAMLLAATPPAAVGVVALFAAARWASSAHEAGADAGQQLGTIIVSLGVFTAVVFLPDYVARRLGLQEPGFGRSGAAALSLVAGAGAWVRSPAAEWVPASVADGVAYMTTLGFVGVCVTAVAASSMYGALRLMVRSRNAALAESVVIGELGSALSALADDGAWRDGARRAAAADHLDRAATVIELGLPERLRSADAATSAVVRERCRRMAAAVREVQRSVLLPGPGTPDAFREFVVAAATAVASGRLDDLPTADPPPGPTRRDVAAGLARTAVLATLPAAVFGVLQASAAAVEGAAAGYVAAACLAWAVLTVIAALDPLFRDKVAAVKEAAGLLRP